MIVPGKRLCDLCKNEIDTRRPYPTMSYPLDQADLHLLAPLPPAQPHDVFPGGLRFLIATATAYSFDFCRECIDALLPMLNDLKTEYIRRLVDERRRQQEIS